MSDPFQRQVSRDSVFQSLVSSLTPDPAIREPAEKQLSQYEKQSVPGYLGTLVEIACATNQVLEVSW